MLLELRKIGKIYNTNNLLSIGIRDINLSLIKNDFVLVTGESGSGKSTLLNVIGANDTYEEGELYIEGQNTQYYSEKDWEGYRKNYISTIFQDFNIIENLTVKENIMLSLLHLKDVKKRKEITNALIEKVGLTKQQNQKTSKLSGGEKQRTVIARALAKDSPIILADEPTGNLDVKSSEEIAKLLHDLSNDKLVIVVSHNPEFFEKYANKTITMKDGMVIDIKENEVSYENSQKENIIYIPKREQESKKQIIKNAFALGFLNYRSRIKFTILMSFILLIYSLTMFIGVYLFNKSLIKPLRQSLDKTPINGKVLITNKNAKIETEECEELKFKLGAKFALVDSNYANFEVVIPNQNRYLNKEHKINFIYSPYEYPIGKNEMVITYPIAYKKDATEIEKIIKDLNIEIKKIFLIPKFNTEDIKAYISKYTILNHGSILKALYSTIHINKIEANIYTFKKNKNLEPGNINLINSKLFGIANNVSILEVSQTRTYLIKDATQENEAYHGIVVELSESDYDETFKKEINTGKHSAFYFENNKIAKARIASLSSDYIAIFSTDTSYLANAGITFLYNSLYYLILIIITIIFSILISIVLNRNVKVFANDFVIYKTLGISTKISNRALYIQMFITFLPIVVLLPFFCLLATLIPTLNISMLSLGNYLFIEAMVLMLVLTLSIRFNRQNKIKNIRNTLIRRSK